ncbi:tyrosine-type recombinase/integrase, partial [Ligilactobacillus salivarius]
MKKGQKIENAEVRSEPLKNQCQIDQVRGMLEKYTREPLRNKIIFNIGINNGIRTGDIVKLKVKDVYNKDYARIRESKTGKTRDIRLNVAGIKQDIID